MTLTLLLCPHLHSCYCDASVRQSYINKGARKRFFSPFPIISSPLLRVSGLPTFSDLPLPSCYRTIWGEKGSGFGGKISSSSFHPPLAPLFLLCRPYSCSLALLILFTPPEWNFATVCLFLLFPPRSHISSCHLIGAAAVCCVCMRALRPQAAMIIICTPGDRVAIYESTSKLTRLNICRHTLYAFMDVNI